MMGAASAYTKVVARLGRAQFEGDGALRGGLPWGASVSYMCGRYIQLGRETAPGGC